MKLTVLLLTAACIHVFVNGKAQTISLSFKKTSLQQVFSAIEKQTGYRFVYLKEELDRCVPATIHVKNTSLNEVLYLCLQNQPVSYTMEDNLIIIHPKELTSPLPSVRNIRGRVTSTDGIPLSGITIQMMGSKTAAVTDDRGEFYLKNVEPTDLLLVSGAEIEYHEVKIGSKAFLEIVTTKKISQLDQVVVIPYGQTTRRLNTGNIAKVTSVEIENQPVSNLLAALEGRVPGMIVTQTSGVPGSAFKVEIRGRSSLDLSLSRNEPFFIIDGVPFEPGNTSYNQLVSAANSTYNNSEGGLSPLHSINPSDIESVEILKDADATAIYGSRGANGVILITTKKGKPGKLVLKASFVQSWTKISRTMDMLNTDEYIQVRREAFSNDGITPDIFNAPDLLLWDTTRYTDFKKLLIGRTAQISTAQISASGGNANTNFLMSGGFVQQNSVYSSKLFDKRGSFHLNVGHTTTDKKLSLQFTGSYTVDDNRMISTDLTSYINTIPNLKLYEEDGTLAWKDNGVYFSSLNGITNPLSLFERKYRSLAANFSGNVNVSYHILKQLAFYSVFGYNQFHTDELSIVPGSSLQPNNNIQPSANFAHGSIRSWIIEPQLQFSRQIIPHQKLVVLLGTTLQQKQQQNQRIEATKYANDTLLGTPEAAGSVKAEQQYSKYKYTASFGRIQYHIRDRYLLSLSGRRDGSSRFGTGKRYADFGSLGAGWIFSEEAFIKHAKCFTFGKLRASYGVTGNDQIGDYQYLDLWTYTSLYQGIRGLTPLRLFNADYNWERNRKAEIAIELELLKRIFLSASYYRNRSSNLLIRYQLPAQTGFSSIVKNFPALVENRGLEMLATVDIFKKDRFLWSISGNITFPSNKLISFPDLENSSYSYVYKVGESINAYGGFKYQGVDPSTGIYSFEEPLEYYIRGAFDPKWYGGIQNNIRSGNWTLNFLFEFRKQPGVNYLTNLASSFPGQAFNQPAIVLERWRNPGDQATVQKFSTVSSQVAAAAYNIVYSDAIYSDASFVRLKNIYLSYDFPESWRKRSGLPRASIYLSAQNLFIVTGYKGSDPESQNIYALPPLKTIAFGIQLTF